MCWLRIPWQRERTQMAWITLNPGDNLGNYHIRALLGVGAMAEVHLATDRRSGRSVALKILRRGFIRNKDRLKRFSREARTLAATKHPNIVAIHEVGQSTGIPYIAMEYVPGGTLRELVDDGPIDLHTVIAFARQIAAGLAEAHKKGVVHRDLKPENIMVTADGQVKILDFGLSKPLGTNKTSKAESAETSEELTLPGTILGTLEYMSPEQASGYRVDYRTDQFAFGAILYELLTGTSAFKRDTALRTLAAIIEGAPAPLCTHLPGSLRALIALIARCIEKVPEARYASMEALGDELEGIELDDDSSGNGWLAVGATVLAALAAGVLI